MTRDTEAQGGLRDTLSIFIDLDVLKDGITTIFYLLTLIFINRNLRPALGDEGIPFPESALLIMAYLTLVLLMATKLIRAIKGLHRELGWPTTRKPSSYTQAEIKGGKSAQEPQKGNEPQVTIEQRLTRRFKK